ncbi:MAG: hypothetical protein OEQ28_09090 [Acidobacteriota bacterium]|nr:hypothetical protein [Acidobacteriota bacterium]
MIAKIVMVLGILGFLLGLFVTGISLALPIMTDGRTSFEEAMLGFIPGMLLIVFSLLLALVGLIFVIKGRKPKA